MIQKANGQTFIDGIPAAEIGALVWRRGLVKSTLEMALCKTCNTDRPTGQMAVLKLNRDGYFGICKACAGGGR